MAELQRKFQRLLLFGHFGKIDKNASFEKTYRRQCISRLMAVCRLKLRRERETRNDRLIYGLWELEFHITF